MSGGSRCGNVRALLEAVWHVAETFVAGRRIGRTVTTSLRVVAGPDVSRLPADLKSVGSLCLGAGVLS